MNSFVSSIAMYPGSLLRSGLKSTAKVVKKISGRIEPNSKAARDGGSLGTAVITKNSADGRAKPVAIQEC